MASESDFLLEAQIVVAKLEALGNERGLPVGTAACETVERPLCRRSRP